MKRYVPWYFAALAVVLFVTAGRTEGAASAGPPGDSGGTEIVAAPEPDAAAADDGAADEDGDGEGKPRDPFRPFMLNRIGRKRTVPKRGVTAYELRQLRLVGVLLDMNPPRALLQDSGGMGYVITPGMQVGRRGGVVTSIEPGRIVVEEKTIDFYGREQASREVLEIPREGVQEAGRE